MPDEGEVSLLGISVKWKGLLAAKFVFMTASSLMYLYYSLLVLRLDLELATSIYLLTVLTFVAVFFGSWSLTFRKSRKKRKKPVKLEDFG